MKNTLSELTIEIVQKCANTCLFCSSLSGPFSKHKIAYDDVINVGRQAKELGLEEISLSGGEPLHHLEFERIVNDLVLLGLRVVIYTTGIVLDGNGNSHAYKQWGKLDKNSVRLVFGVQSSSSDIHDKITCNEGSFCLTKSSISSAIADEIPVEVHIVPNKINLHTLDITVCELLSLGINRISFLRLVVQGYARKNKEELLLDQSETEFLKSIFSDIIAKYQNENRIRIGVPFSGVISKPSNCNAGMSKLIIRYDGKILPCEAFKDQIHDRFILGDIKYDALEEVLFRTKNNIDLKNLKNRVTSIETCPAQFIYT